MKIVYELTDICNGNCGHCYQRTGKSVLLTRNIEQCKREISVLLNQGHKVTLGGAENLTQKKFLEIYQFVGQDYLLSNGILPVDESGLCDEMFSYGIRELHLSWHIGFSNALSSTPEETVRRAINNALRAGLSVRVMCIIGNFNFNRLDEIIETVMSTGAKSLKLIQFLPVAESLRQYQLTDEQRNSVFVRIAALRERYDKNIFRIEVQGSFNAAYLTEERRASSDRGEFCPAGGSFITIATDNTIYPCPFLNNPEFCMGFFDGKKLIISRQIINDGKFCLAALHFIKRRQ